LSANATESRGAGSGMLNIGKMCIEFFIWCTKVLTINIGLWNTSN